MFNLFAKTIIPEEIEALQNLQYSEKLLLEDTVPANSSKLGKVAISSLGDFYCVYFTGDYTTLKDDGSEDTVDWGLCSLRGKLSDGSNRRQLFNTFIPLNLFLTPGRIKSSDSVNVATDALGDGLFYPQVFQYMFSVNSEILFDVENLADEPNSYRIVFHGVRLPTAQKSKRKSLNDIIRAKRAQKKALTKTRVVVQKPVAAKTVIVKKPVVVKKPIIVKKVIQK